MSATKPVEMTPSSAPPKSGGATGAGTVPAKQSAGAILAARGGYVVFLVLIIACAAVKPNIFLTWGNAKSILELSAVPVVLAAGITPVLLAGEFDLAFASIAGLAAAVAAVLMATDGWAAVPAVVAAIAVAGAAGAGNAFVVVHERVQSFVGTLAVGSVAAGIELAVGKDSDIYSGISHPFLHTLNAKPLLGLTTPVWVALVVTLVLVLLIRHSAIGHQMAAIGGNKEAARLAGVRVDRRLAQAFIISGVASGIAAMLIVGQADAYSPNAAAGYLLSSYTAAFVGLAFNGRSRFSAGGTILGVLLIEVLQNGLNITNQPVWVDSVINGLVLLAAVRLTLGKRRA